MSPEGDFQLVAERSFLTVRLRLMLPPEISVSCWLRIWSAPQVATQMPHSEQRLMLRRRSEWSLLHPEELLVPPLWTIESMGAVTH